MHRETEGTWHRHCAKCLLRAAAPRLKRGHEVRGIKAVPCNLTRTASTLASYSCFAQQAS